MTPDTDCPEVLLSVSNDIEASSIVIALAQYGIEATAAGGFISGFKAEVPSSVDILVKRADLDRASQALAEIHEHPADEIDWDSVDVMEGAEEELPAVETDDDNVWAPAPGRIWLAMALLAILVGCVAVLFAVR